MDYKRTRLGCYMGYITQAAVNNYLPLLFVTLEKRFGLGADKLSALIAANFLTQLLIDLISPIITKNLGRRAALLFGCVTSTLGLSLLSVLPFAMKPMAGLFVCVVLSAIGGGIMEVLVSPVIEDCPSDNKAGQMSLLHSFYCWGAAGCVLVSTVFFAVFGRDSWRILSIVWAMIPAFDLLLFVKAPIPETSEEAKSGKIFGSGVFYILIIMMLCAGASELAISQWASAFAETSLNITKSAGDIAGPFAFALLMGTSRLVGTRVRIEKLPGYMTFSALLCAAGYCLTAFCAHPAASLAGCGICGLAVAIMWPGTYSIAAKLLPGGGTLMFALLALAGDLGCTSGPVIVGLSKDLRIGFSFALIFPILMTAMLIILSAKFKDKLKDN